MMDTVPTDGSPAAVSPAPRGVRALRARERDENFPVSLLFLPRRHRGALHAIYAFARTVDEYGDSYAGDRTARLHRLEEDLDLLWSGHAVSDPVLSRLQPVVRCHSLPREPFHALIRANLQDQVVHRYETFADLRCYCGLSAEPVGRLVLEVFGQSTPEAVALSDQVCTALQLLEHWQDVGEDRRAGRVYLPQEDLLAWGVDEIALDALSAAEPLRSLMRFQIERAAALLADGSPLLDMLHGWALPSVAGFVAGGQATVAALRRTDGDVLAVSAHPSRRATAARLLELFVGTLARRRRPR